MNRQIRRLAVAVVVLYVALFVKLNQTQLIDAPRLNSRPDNTRQIERDFNRARGNITTADGKLVATSVATAHGSQFQYQRQYPLHDLFAHVAGSYSYLFGSDGVERTYNDDLSGQTPALKLKGFTNPFVKQSNVGNVELTLRSTVQQAAKDALGQRKGSVVALDPRTGAILAMWSYPSYDPNFTSSIDPAIARKSRELYTADPDKPQLAKAWRDRFFPGSTFKIVTAAAGLESGKVTPASPVYPRQASYTPPLTSKAISNFGGAVCGGALFDLLKVSCNSGMAAMGAETVGPQLMVQTAENFGFNAAPPVDLPGAVNSVFPTDFGKRVRPSTTPGNADVYENSAALAQASIGQNDTSATPLEMAMVAGAVADDGTIMVPHVMAKVTDGNGGVLRSYPERVWKKAVTPTTAATLRQAMIGVVQGGTATGLAIAGVDVGGKTGTAQLGTDPPRSHAWIIGFAGPPGQPATVAVAVLVEGQPGASEQTGGKVAAPIAKAVIEAALAGS